MAAFLVICVSLLIFQQCDGFSVRHSRYRLNYPLKLKVSDVSNDELDNLKIDTSKLSDEQKKRLDFIDKLTNEADDFARAAGMIVEDDEKSNLVEKSIEETKWSGQSDMEKTYISTNNWGDLFKRLDLASGDIAALLAFSIGGRLSHNEGIDPVDLFITAAPFVFSWLFISPFLGAYSREATSSKAAIASKLVFPWAVSIPAALVVRGLSKGYVPPITFIMISMTVTFVSIFIWRTFYVSAFGATSDKEYKEAGFFEVFKMIGTLIRRW
jgi:hypothetical protein